MIRTLSLLCSECGETFASDGIVYYRDNYLAASIRDAKFICPACIEKWRQKWQVKNAVFREADYVLTADIELEDGSVYKNMDCTAIEETQTVVAGEDIPEAAQRRLYEFYAAWDRERKAHLLKDLTFADEFMRMSFTCETYGGESYENIAFRFTMKGELQTEKPVPDYIKEQIKEAYQLYEAQAGEE